MLTKILINLTVFFIIFIKLEAVPAVVQLKLAEMWFQVIDKYNSKEKQDFILGSLIKNIEYLDNLSKEGEVNSSVNLKEVYEALTPFEAGELFYLYVDQKREKILHKWGVGDLIIDISKEQLSFFLKLLEDEVVYNPQLCGKGSSYLSGISEGEILTGIRVEKLAVWHGVLYKYFSQKPSGSLLSLQKDKRIKYVISEETVYLWKENLIFFSINKKIKDYIEDLFLDFENNFELFKLKYLKEKN